MIAAYAIAAALVAIIIAAWWKARHRGLGAMIAKSSRRAMTTQEKEAQRESFAYGNTKLGNAAITSETISRAIRVEGSRSG